MNDGDWIYSVITRRWSKFGGVESTLTAIFHVVVIVVGISLMMCWNYYE